MGVEGAWFVRCASSDLRNACSWHLFYLWATSLNSLWLQRPLEKCSDRRRPYLLAVYSQIHMHPFLQLGRDLYLPQRAAAGVSFAHGVSQISCSYLFLVISGPILDIFQVVWNHFLRVIFLFLFALCICIFDLINIFIMLLIFKCIRAEALFIVSCPGFGMFTFERHYLLIWTCH